MSGHFYLDEPVVPLALSRDGLWVICRWRDHRVWAHWHEQVSPWPYGHEPSLPVPQKAGR